MAADEQLITVSEAGRILGVSESTVWRRIRSGALPSVRRNGRRLVPRRALKRASARRFSAIPPFTPDHALLALAGAGRGGGRRPGAREKHAILDE